MTTEPLARKSPFSDPTIWIPVGLAVGSVAGLLFHDVISGTVIGMMTGDVVAMLIQRRRKKKPSRLVIAVGVLAVVVVGVTVVIRGI